LESIPKKTLGRSSPKNPQPTALGGLCRAYSEIDSVKNHPFFEILERQIFQQQPFIESPADVEGWEILVQMILFPSKKSRATHPVYSDSSLLEETFFFPPPLRSASP